MMFHLCHRLSDDCHPERGSDMTEKAFWSSAGHHDNQGV